MGKSSSPRPPPPPDPRATAQAQAQANRDAILTSAAVNRYDEVTPWGSVTWERPPSRPAPAAPQTAGYQPGFIRNTVGQSLPAQPSASSYAGDLGGWTRKTELSPEMQRQFDARNQLADILGGQAVNRAGQIDQGRFSLSGLPGVSEYNVDPALRGNLDFSNLQDVNLPGAVPDAPYPLPDVPGSDNDISAVEQSTYDRMMGLMNPEFERQQRDLQTRLSTTGLPVGSEAYNEEMNRFDESRSKAMNRAALDAVRAGRQEHSRLFDIGARQFGMGSQRAQQGFDMARDRFGMESQQAALASALRGQQVSEQLSDADLASRAMANRIGFEESARGRGLNERLLERTQPMNELAAILQGTPAMQAPTSAQPAQYQAAPADVTGAVNTAYQGALNNYNTQMGNRAAKKGGTTGLAGTLGAAAILCDRRLKRNARLVGEYNGHAIYAFNYLWSPDVTSYGPMADEVKLINPDAVMTINGYDAVLVGEL